MLMAFVALQSSPSDCTLHQTVDFVVFLVIFNANCHPVLIAEKAQAPQTRNRTVAKNFVKPTINLVQPDS